MSSIEAPIINSADPVEVVNGNQNATMLQLAMTALRLTSGNDGSSNLKPTVPHQRLRKQITLSEVAYHDSYDDCWIVLYDRVYDITKFLNLHPGGHDVLVENAGRDATIAFLGTGHSDIAMRSLKLYEVGELPPHECIYRCAGKLTVSHLPD